MTERTDVMGSPDSKPERYAPPMIEVIGTVEDTLGTKPPGTTDELVSGTF